MTLKRRLVTSLICLGLLLGTEAVLTSVLNRGVEHEAQEALGHGLAASDGAVERALALATVRAAMLELLAESYHQANSPSGSLDSGELVQARAEVVSGLEQLERTLALQGVVGGATGADHLQAALRREFDVYRGQVETALALAKQSPAAAHRLVNHAIETQVEQHLYPLIENRRQAAEGELRTRAERIAERSQHTTRLVVVINGVTVLLAVAVGLSLLRSTTQKVDQLVLAASAVGQGRLDTRVRISSHDDLGFLANTFNQMAEDLTRTTVSRRELDDVLETMPGALFLLSADLAVTRANEAALELLGESQVSLAGKTLPEFCVPACGEISAQVPQQAAEPHRFEGTLTRSDGQRVEVLVSISTLGRRVGSADVFVCVAHDITDRKRAESNLRGLLAEKDLLLREVHHRVKNNLQVVSSLLDLQSNRQESQELRQLLGESRNRIRCMALIHEQLYRSSSDGRVDLRAYLGELTGALARSQGAAAEGVSISLEVEDLELGIDQAVPIGLIVNELVSNSFRHAFGATGRGNVRLRLEAGSGSRCVLIVADDGCGLPAAPSSTSLGLTLVRALARQLGGTLETTTDAGTRVRLEFPVLPESLRHAA